MVVAEAISVFGDGDDRIDVGIALPGPVGAGEQGHDGRDDPESHYGPRVATRSAVHAADPSRNARGSWNLPATISANQGGT